MKKIEKTEIVIEIKWALMKKNVLRILKKKRFEDLDEDLDDDLESDFENASFMNTKLVNLHVIFSFSI
jgi:hypothetical protein